MMKFLMWVPLFILRSLARAFTLKMLWVWFILTQWTHAPNLGMMACLGLSTLIGIFTLKMPTEVEEVQAKALKVANESSDANEAMIGNKYAAYHRGMDRAVVQELVIIFHSLAALSIGYGYHYIQMSF